MNARRLYAPVVLATLAAGGVALYAVGRIWARSDVVAEGLSTDMVSATGSDAHPLASALALVVIASAVAILAASRRVRRAVGVLTVIVAVIAVWVIVRRGDAVDEAVAAAVRQSPAFTGTNQPGEVHHSAWPVVAIAAFAVAAVLGGITTRLASAWPTMGSRYDAPPARQSTQASQDDDMWKALDEGRDPTK